MKNNRKISKKAMSLFAVIILIALLFFFLQKFNDNTNGNSKNKSDLSTEELKSKELDDKSGKTFAKDAETVPEKSGENEASVDTKEQENDKDIKSISNEQGIAVLVKAANFGSTAEILIDSSKFNNRYKHYQFFLGSKPISSIESITKASTTMFPAVEAGSEVVLKLLDENKKVMQELKMKLSEKK
jgi:preprotein translocase subunit SecF